MFSLRDQTLVLQILGTGFESAMVETSSSGIDSETYVYSKVFPERFLVYWTTLEWGRRAVKWHEIRENQPTSWKLPQSRVDYERGPHLVLLMSDPHLLFEDGCASCLLLSHYSLLLQLRTPEALDAVCGGSQLTVLQVELSAQQLVLPLHIPELGLHLQELPSAPPHRLPEQDRGHPLVVQHREGAQVAVRQEVSMMR